MEPRSIYSAPLPQAQQTHQAPARKSGSKLKVFMITLLVLILVAGVGFGVYMRQSSKNQTITQKLQNNIAELEQQLQDQKAALDKAKTSSKSSGPVVIYDPAGLFDEKETKDLKAKLVNPLTDYTPDKVASIHIEVYTPDKFVTGNGDSKYLVTVINKDGTYNGFAYGSKKSGNTWWIPDCLNKCTFTTEFTKKYPELIKKYKASQ